MSGEVPKCIEKWFNSVVEINRRQTKDDDSAARIERKVEHTKRVVEWGNKIMEKEEGEWNREQGLVVCQLHDIGRFTQALQETFGARQLINHSITGRELFLSSSLNLNDFDGNEVQIAEAISEHNNPYYRGDNKYVKLVRDADQLAILEELEWQIAGKEKHYRFSGEINERLIEKFKKKEVLDTKEAITAGEWLLCFKSWEVRFNFEATGRLYRQAGFDEKIKEMFKGMFPDKTELFDYFNTN